MSQAAERRKADYERHRRFLSAVSGVEFEPPFLDPKGRLVFRGLALVRKSSGPLPLMLESVVSCRKDFEP